MAVLVTRPSPDGEQLTAQLRELAIPAWWMPMIAIRAGQDLPALSARLARLHQGDLVIALSRHAVRFAADAVNRWPAQVQYCAIGRSTAQALQDIHGYSVLYPLQSETSESLLKLRALHHVTGKNVLLLRGNCGRELLGNTLRERGARIQYCECYRRVPLRYDGQAMAQRWQERNITTLVVTSGEILQALWTLIPEPWRHNWLTRCHIIVVSPRLAALASARGWSQITVTDKASNTTLVDVIKKNFKQE